MISIKNLSYYIGDRVIYDEVNLHIKPKDKIGLIGYNGMGKSTLLHIIEGNIIPDSGEISKAKDCTLGFLNQDLLSYESDESILSVAMQAFQDVVDLQLKIDAIIKKMETNYEDKLVDQLTKSQEEFEAKDGYAAQSKAEEVLEGIGFKTTDLSRPLREFSGGWRMRVMLAKLLLEKPSLLMLDEPTNHLDLPSIEWLEKYLSNYSGAYIIVSHDRDFLNGCTTKTVEVLGGDLSLYEGNYDFYETEKTLREEIQKNAFANQQQKIKETERFIERFRSKATKAKQVQSKIKMLEKMNMINDVIDTSRKINIRFTFKQKSGREVMTLENFSKSFGSQTILKNTEGVIMRGDKIALIGPNGIGKSTLLRIIAGQEPIQGHRKEGHNVIPSFYAQHQLESLNIEADVLEELKMTGSGKLELELRQILGCFLFTGDDVFKKIKVLSGGEKSRVALAKTLISEANFLLLDEPTNHLDMLSEGILIQALQQYEGSIILVSHNRHFVSEVANKIWFIENQTIKEYPGTYKEYIQWQAGRQNKPLPNNFDNKKTREKNNKKRESEKKQKTRDQKADFLLKKMEKQSEVILEKIDKLESRKKVVEHELYLPDAYKDIEKFDTLQEEFTQLDDEIRRLNEAWDEIANQLDP